MNKLTLFSKEFRSTTPWITTMKEREMKKTPTYEMQQRVLPQEVTATEPLLSRMSNEVAERIEDIRADLSDLPLRPALVQVTA